MAKSLRESCESTLSYSTVFESQVYTLQGRDIVFEGCSMVRLKAAPWTPLLFPAVQLQKVLPDSLRFGLPRRCCFDIETKSSAIFDSMLAYFA